MQPIIELEAVVCPDRFDINTMTGEKGHGFDEKVG